MTSKSIPRNPSAASVEKFPTFPPRDDMQNYLHLYLPGHPGALQRHFGISDTTVILGEAPVRWFPSQERGHRIPDLLVAFDANRGLAVEQMGYSIREQGKPPDFVLEIASPTTGQEDYTGKRRDYAAFGISEYWRFDGSGGLYQDAPMAGDRLVNGIYQPIDIIRVDETHLWGGSDVLGLYLCWEESQLRWYDPAAQRYLLTGDEIAEELDSERDARIAAEEERDRARNERDTERERVRELEAELKRLRGS